jgi:hypothetical protein
LLSVFIFCGNQRKLKGEERWKGGKEENRKRRRRLQRDQA